MTIFLRLLAYNYFKDVFVKFQFSAIYSFSIKTQFLETQKYSQTNNEHFNIDFLAPQGVLSHNHYACHTSWFDQDSPRISAMSWSVYCVYEHKRRVTEPRGIKHLGLNFLWYLKITFLE